MVIEKLYGCDQTLTGPFADLRFVHLPEKNVWHLLAHLGKPVGYRWPKNGGIQSDYDAFLHEMLNMEESKFSTKKHPA